MGTWILIKFDVTPSWWTSSTGSPDRGARAAVALNETASQMGYNVHKIGISTTSLTLTVTAPTDVVDLGALDHSFGIIAEGVQ